MDANRIRYDEDFAAWAHEQAALLRAGDFSGVDFENVAEEIASLGRKEQGELENRVDQLLTHLLKA